MQEALAAAGFDLAHELDTRAIRALPEGRGVLIGNTRALWPRFEAARRDEPDALDRYTERTLEAAVTDARVFFAHRMYDGAFIPFQQLAVVSGFAALAPSRLLVHPVHGPWFALRALVIFEGERGPVRTPIAQPCRCDGRCERAVEEALADPLAWPRWVAVRDACALRAQRYSDEQVRFHYTHAFGSAPPRSGD